MDHTQQLAQRHHFAGARMLRDLLRREGHSIGRRHMDTLMTRIGIAEVYRKPHTSQRHPAHPAYSYFLRDVEVTRSNHVWAAEITYIPIHSGFMYLCAVMDGACRQFTSLEFTGILKAYGIQISMDGTGCWRDNVFVERHWKSIKYEEVYLHACETLNAAQQGLERYLTFYNQTRPHRALDGYTPDGVYFDNRPTRLTAA